MGRQLRVLIIVENLPVPFDRRVWSEATTLRDAGHAVSVICPKGPGYQRAHEVIDGISDLSPSLADRGARRRGLFHRISDRIVLGVRARAEGLAAPRLRRDPCLQSARPHLPDRAVLQDFRRQELRIRPSRRQPGVLRGKVRPPRASSGSCCGSPRSSPSRPPISPSPRTSPIAASPSSAAACARSAFSWSAPVQISTASRSFPPIRPGARAVKFLVGYVGVISRSEGIDLLLSSDQPHRLCPRPSRHSVRRGRQRPGA